jgi:AraC family transcriptional regulator
VLRYVGRDEGLRDAVHGLRQWVAANRHVERDAPPFLQRITFFPDVAEHEAVTDVFVPIV